MMSLHARVVLIKNDIASTAAGARENTEAMKCIAEDTRGIVEMLSPLKGGLKVLIGIIRMPNAAR